MKKLLFIVIVLLSGTTFAGSFFTAEIVSQKSEILFNKSDADSLIYQKWILTKLNGKEDVKEKAGKNIPYLEFHLKDNKLSGNTGCNSVYGLAFITGNNITFSEISTTKMGCRNEKFNRYEMEFQEIIFYKEPLKYKIENNILTIFKDGVDFMVLEADKPE